MSYGLQIFNPDGSLSFDSNVCGGGVCLGIFTVAVGGSVFSFPEFGATYQGFALSTGRTIAGYSYSTDTLMGYLRFMFNSIAAGQNYALFAK